MLKMGDCVDTAPAGVDAAWINTQSGKTGHRRRGSLPIINPLPSDDEDDESDSDSSESSSDSDDSSS